MLRQISRLILFLLVKIKNLVIKYPGPTLGFVLGSIIGYILSVSMIRYGFPRWVLPVQTLAWAVVMSRKVKEYLDRLTK